MTVAVVPKTYSVYVVENNLGLYAPNGKKLTEAIEKIYAQYNRFTSSKEVSFETDKIVDFLVSLKVKP